MAVFDCTYLASIYRLQGIGFWESAKTLSAAFETSDDEPPTSLSAIPFYYLASHAAELLLKSALLKRGFTESDLRTSEYRHSLLALLQALKDKGLAISQDTVNVVNGLHSQHETHALRYTVLVDDGKKTYMPPPSMVFAMLDELMMLTALSTQGM